MLSSSVQRGPASSRPMTSMPSTSSPAPTGTTTTSRNPRSTREAASSSPWAASRASSPQARVRSTSSTRCRAQQARAESCTAWCRVRSSGSRAPGGCITRASPNTSTPIAVARSAWRSSSLGHAQQLLQAVPADGRADHGPRARREPDAGGVLLALDGRDDTLQADVQVGPERHQLLAGRSAPRARDVEVDERPQPARRVTNRATSMSCGCQSSGERGHLAVGHDDVGLDALPRLRRHRLPGHEREHADLLTELHGGVHRVQWGALALELAGRGVVGRDRGELHPVVAAAHLDRADAEARAASQVVRDPPQLGPRRRLAPASLVGAIGRDGVLRARHAPHLRRPP